MAQLELKGVSKFFGGLAAVNNLDLAVDQGEIVERRVAQEPRYGGI